MRVGWGGWVGELDVVCVAAWLRPEIDASRRFETRFQQYPSHPFSSGAPVQPSLRGARDLY